MSYDYCDKLDATVKGRYNNKIEAVKLEKCPYKSSTDCWLNDPSKWPDVYE